MVDRELVLTALVRFLAGFVILLGVLLLSAGTTAYWEAWVYLAVVFAPMTCVFVYLLKKDPELLERRMRTREKQAEQQRIVKLGSLSYVLVFLLPGLDRRFGWSEVPVSAVVAADVFFLLGYALFVLVLRENSFASRVVAVEEGQQVVTTGPYAVVRHPMYIATIVMLIATPVALGSWWAVVPALSLIPIFVVRIRGEEALLSKELHGYVEYVHRVRYRLIPGAW